MSSETFIRHCSPTLAGLKTGSLFGERFENDDKMRENIRFWNKIFTGKGLRVIPIKNRTGRTLIYIFRISELEHSLEGSVATEILSERGYPKENTNSKVAYLSRRIRESEDFPHEIGLFLGYPAEDVKGFIEEGSENCKYCGCWKVYKNVDKAIKTFSKYKKCTDIYSRLYSEGSSIEKLTVKK